jgi:hypothetical protein
MSNWADYNYSADSGISFRSLALSDKLDASCGALMCGLCAGDSVVARPISITLRWWHLETLCLYLGLRSAECMSSRSIRQAALQYVDCAHLTGATRQRVGGRAEWGTGPILLKWVKVIRAARDYEVSMT